MTIAPYKISAKDWADELARDWPQARIPILMNSEVWRPWAALVLEIPAFAAAAQLDPFTFADFVQFADRFRELVDA